MRYRAFGLVYETEQDWWPLRQVPTDDEAPVEVVQGLVPDRLAHAVIRRTRFESAGGVLLFRTRTVADFLVEAGRRIVVAPKPGHDPWLLCNLTLGVVTGAVLLQRQVPALHGCTVDTPTGAVVICGASGAGKSTLALLLKQRGYRLLDDNIAPLTRHGDRWTVAPGSGFIRVTPSTYTLLAETPAGPSFTAALLVKHLHPLTDAEWTGQDRPLRDVWLLDREADTLLTPLSVVERMATLRTHWFAGHLAHGLGASPLLFDAALALARHLPMRRLGRPPALTLHDWADAVASSLAST